VRRQPPPPYHDGKNLVNLVLEFFEKVVFEKDEFKDSKKCQMNTLQERSLNFILVLANLVVSIKNFFQKAIQSKIMCENI
jgi:hypothetical protein